ncbi:hypothetical protein GQ457_17G020200 [Hibiscus cannabinus]
MKKKKKLKKFVTAPEKMDKWEIPIHHENMVTIERQTLNGVCGPQTYSAIWLFTILCWRLWGRQGSLDSGLTPNEKTLTSLAKIYGKARWAKDALELREEMKSKNWLMDFTLYNTLLTMCADIGLVEEAEQLFMDMKQSRRCRPDSWSYTAMLKIYGTGGNVGKAMEFFEELSEVGVELNVMGATCLIQCLGKAGRIDELVRVFSVPVRQGIEPDDRICGCLLSVVSRCESRTGVDKVLACLQQANPRKAATIVCMSRKKDLKPQCRKFGRENAQIFLALKRNKKERKGGRQLELNNPPAYAKTSKKACL